jgi:hypothetical protein
VSEELLAISLSAAVPLRIMDLQRLGVTSVEDLLFDDIVCLECKGQHKSKLHARQRGNNGECSICEGRGWIPRNIAYSYYLGSHGDDLLFKSKKAGDTAKVFNILADGLARLSFVPGGVDIFGMHFETGSYAKRLRKVIQIYSIQDFAKRLRKVEFTKRVRKVIKDAR